MQNRKKTQNMESGKGRGFWLNPEVGYFENGGVNVMAFDDIYPAGHQSGISLIMHGRRVATNGDIRFEPTPGQWQPVPRQGERIVDEEEQTITTTLSYPDMDAHLRGFNPIIYPDFAFAYEVKVKAEGDSVSVTVDLDREIPEAFAGKLCFNLELFPGELFGKPWIMDGRQGIFPRQANGPVRMRPSNAAHPGSFQKTDWKQKQENFDELEDFLRINDQDLLADAEQLTGDGQEYSPIVADDLIGEPYAVGRRLTVRPDDPYSRLVIESKGAELKLYDGRMNHNNGWFVVSSEVPEGRTKGAVCWTITPHAVEDWRYTPVVQVSQVGYHPLQPKTAVVELDKRGQRAAGTGEGRLAGLSGNDCSEACHGADEDRTDIVLYRITEDGPREYMRSAGEEWGEFLRYRYLRFDFTGVREEGLYQVGYGESLSSIFRIAEDVYDRGVWQPVLEYFLPVQMCHMRVNEKYRVWHGLCHADDARMAPVHRRHFDGYMQGASTLTRFRPGEFVPGLNAGGWHDAGDYDLRVESQSGEAYILALAYEAFHVEYDATTINQQARLVEIHQPDGKNDILQQIEHGALAVVSGYRAMGRLYRGIIAGSLRQYVLLGDASVMTDGMPDSRNARWVFTEDNPQRELSTAAHLAAISHALKDFEDALSGECLEIARKLFAESGCGKVSGTRDSDAADEGNRKAAGGECDERILEAGMHAAVELYLATGEEDYRRFLLERKEFLFAHMRNLGWLAARVNAALGDADFTGKLREALLPLKTEIERQSAETPYGIPYRPHIWGAGWGIQALGMRYYFLHRAFPELFGPELLFGALNFVLGCHPGSNTASFASGVGAKSMTAAYCAYRADWSYIPGGVASGTALIRPDFPELLDFPFLWQQAEYVLGGGSSNYLFLVLAVKQVLEER